MDILTLKNRIHSNLPIYLGEKMVTIIEIYDIFNLIEVKFKDEEEKFVVDIITLKDKCYNDKGIPLNLFTNRGEKKC